MDGLLARLCRRLRAAFPGVTLRVRLDGGFASPEVLNFLDREGVEYVVAMASNARLVKRVRRLMDLWGPWMMPPPRPRPDDHCPALCHMSATAADFFTRAVRAAGLARASRPQA